jgi:hypothetical protein
VAALTEVLICNMSLSRIGVSEQIVSAGGTIAGASTSSVAQEQCLLWYDRCRDRVLEAAPWTFARGFVLLVEADDGDGEIWEDTWDFAYTYPADCVTVRRFVDDVNRGYGYADYGYGYQDSTRGIDRSWRFVIRQHASAKVIMTDVTGTNANIEYTKRVTDVLLFTEEFASALAWNLAVEIAGPLSVSPALTTAAGLEYQRATLMAQASMLNEENPRPDGDEVFVRARGAD